MARARTIAEVIAGEAVSGTPEERIADMRAIASVIANRAQQLGVTPEEVVSNSREFNAYNRSLPPGVGQNLVDMAQEQIDYVSENGPTNQATFYATPAAADNLPNGLSYETSTTGHQYFSDPQGRAIGTSNGYVQPNQYAYAANPENVPAPSLASSAVTAYQPETQSQGPFDAVLSQPSSWGINQDVAPALTPTVETWSDMAAAKPISTVFGTSPGFIADAAANPAQSAAQPISQADISRAFFNPTGAGQMDPSFTEGLMGPSNSVVPSSVQSVSYTPDNAVDIASSRFSTPAKTSRIGEMAFDASRMGGLVDPATNTQSFMDQPSAPTDLGGFASAMTAQRGAPTGLLSADSQTIQGLAEKQLANSVANPSLAAAYTAPTATTPAEQAIAAQINPTATPAQQAAGYGQLAPAPGLTNLSGGSLYDVDLSGNVVAATPYTPTGAVPSLETVTVADQPAVATVDGPVSTPAVDQQVQTSSTTPAATTTQPATTANNAKGPFSGLFNKGTIGGGVIGSVIAGPLGGAIGALLGNQIAKGGMSNPFSGGGFMAPTTQIGGGIANIGSIYGGQQTPGTYAMASNGAQITAQPGGYTSVVTPSGQNEVVSPTGQISHNFGSLFGGAATAPDQETAA